MKKILFLGYYIFILLQLQSCYRIVPSEGGGDLNYIPKGREAEPLDVIVPEGYNIEIVAKDLTFPTAVTFDDNDNLYVLEAGYSYGEEFLEPKLFKIEGDGTKSLVLSGQKNGPWTGVTYFEGHFFLAEGGQLEGGKILKVNKQGDVTILVENLPSYGDHHTNGPVVQNNYVYFGQGTATNSGIVGNDNAKFGWLYRNPDFHDIPCKDITINALNNTTDNVLTKDPDDKAITGPYSPYNKPVESNQVIKGATPCTGSVMKVPVSGGEPELVAWGFRNPYGLAISPDEEIYITENSYDDRGSRPVWGTGDILWKLEDDAWYGWPDYNGSNLITKMNVPGKENPKPVYANNPGIPPKPVATFAVHSSSNGISFSSNPEFGFLGQAFVAQFGDMASSVGKVLSPVGFKVVRVDVTTGIVEDFALNSLKKNGPATWLKNNGLERPVSVQFNPEGDALYIVDFGILTVDKGVAKPYKHTGVIWKVTKEK